MPLTRAGIADHTSTRAIGESVEEGGSSGSLGWVVLVLVVIGALLGAAIWLGMVPDGWLPLWLEG
ncbi:MAG TPA: hypothetical protein VGP45_08425 [Marinobacter sp.]|nr:hypothetical protein [Marinobacter sp.]